MASYWVFLNNEVSGPFTVEQLIRLRGFSRQAQVCIEDGSGRPTRWISPAEIPELAHIFKVADQMHEAPPPRSTPRPAPKPAPRAVARPVTPAPAPSPEPSKPLIWPWLVLAVIFIGGGILRWYQVQLQQTRRQEKLAAGILVKQAPLPATDPYGTIQRYIEQKQISPRWEFERTSEGLYHVTVSWFGSDGRSQVYSFEVNLQAQTVRGLNSAAAVLLAQGFVPPPPPKIPPKPKTVSELFHDAVNGRRDALEKGDFQSVWALFSQRKRMDMVKAGMSESGFTRLQSLTHGLESGMHQNILKTKQDAPGHMLVAIRQTQDNHPDILIKQSWVYEEGAWKLDDEDKRAASSGENTEPAPAVPPATADSGSSAHTSEMPTNPAPAAKAKPSVLSLPGLSN